jgi:hypothetical protein
MGKITSLANLQLIRNQIQNLVKYKSISNSIRRGDLMVCYTIPLATGVIFALRRRLKNKKDKEGFWLNLMFLGASLFGVIDHLWNGELFLIGENVISDIFLGVTITLSVFVAWGLMVNKDKLMRKIGFLDRRSSVYKKEV